MIRATFLSILVAAASFAQARREFEVASSRAVSNQPPAQVAVGLTIDGSQVRITYLSLKDYLAIAYRMKLNQIVGPDWLPSQRFDIAAKLPDGAAQADVPEMLQALLADRFQLKAHRDMKEFPVYVLEAASTGLKISPVDPEGDGIQGRPLNIAAGGNNGGAAISFGQGSSITLGEKSFEAKKLSMATLADMLTRFLDRPVVDKTNIKGAFDLSLELTPEDRLAMLIRSAVSAGVVLPPQALAVLDTASGDSLSNSLKKVGLTLEGKRLPLDVLIVDQIQKTPSDN